MAGILGIYGMIVAVIITQKSKINIKKIIYSPQRNRIYTRLGIRPFCCWFVMWFQQFSKIYNFILKAAGYAIGMVGDCGVRCNALQDKIFVGMILILIFAEALGLYGLIVALILSSA